MSDSDQLNSLPFEEKKQQAFLGHVFTPNDGKIFLSVKDKVRPEWFVNGHAARLYKGYQEFFKKANRVPMSHQEFLGMEEFRAEDMATKQKIAAYYALCQNEKNLWGWDLISKELSTWLKVRIYHEGVTKSAHAFNQKKLESAITTLTESVKQFQDVSFDGAAPSDFSNPRGLVESMQVETSDALSTGLDIFDNVLNPDCKKGSLLKGDTTVLLAATGRGKTASMLSMARHNVMSSKSVLFIALEGREGDLMEKIWTCTLGVTKKEFRRMALSMDPQDAKHMAAGVNRLQNYLHHVWYVKAEMYVEDVISMIRQKNDQRIALYGQGYDMVMVDYPALLMSKTFGSNNEQRFVLKHVYRQLINLAGELRHHAVLAVQSNREASKVNKGTAKDGNRLLTKEDISEAWGITNDATNIITINRSPLDEMNNRLTYYIDKCRSNMTGWAVVCRTNFAHTVAHSNDLGGCVYRGTDTLTDKIDRLLAEHPNQIIPPEKLR